MIKTRMSYVQWCFSNNTMIKTMKLKQSNAFSSGYHTLYHFIIDYQVIIASCLLTLLVSLVKLQLGLFDSASVV